nr:NaeI family type II restriction endonuclease [Streptomyces niveus]
MKSALTQGADVAAVGDRGEAVALDDGHHAMDFSIVGVDADCRFSLTFGGWTFPTGRWVTSAFWSGLTIN